MENSKYIINLIIKIFTNWGKNKCNINILSKKKKKSTTNNISNKNNVRDTNDFTKFFTNGWYDEWLLVNEKVILMVSLDENQ